MATYQGAAADFINRAVISGNPANANGNDILHGDNFDGAAAADYEAIQLV